MRKIIPILVLVVACVPKTIPDDVRPIYTANEILIRVGELQNVTINMYDSGQLSKEKAELIVFWCVQTAKVLKEVPSNWRQTVTLSFAELENKVGEPQGLLSKAWDALKSMIWWP